MFAPPENQEPSALSTENDATLGAKALSSYLIFPCKPRCAVKGLSLPQYGDG
jgi:hypothetical protein